MRQRRVELEDREGPPVRDLYDMNALHLQPRRRRHVQPSIYIYTYISMRICIPACLSSDGYLSLYLYAYLSIYL